MKLHLFLFLYTVSAVITEVDKIRIDNKLEQFSDLLEQNHNSIQDKVVNLEEYKRCTYNVACEGNTVTWPGAQHPAKNLEPNPLFNNVSVNVDESLVKIIYGTTESQDILNEICMINSQKNVWKNNLDQENISGLVWQYYGGESSISVFHPSFRWSDVNQCPTDPTQDYDPRRRPWYVSGASGQKNVMVMIDLSDTHTDNGNRMEMMKYSVVQLLRSLSYRDYVSITTYTEFTKHYIGNMIRATTANIQSLILYVESLDVVPESKSNIGFALKDTYNLLQKSLDNGDTSLCHNMLLIFSSGSNDITIDNPLSIVEQNLGLDVTIFSNIYGSDTTVGGKLDLAEISCKTNGNLFMIESLQESEETIDKFNDYLSTITFNKAVRWSEPYEEALEQGRLITGSLPIYKTIDGLRTVYGITSIDLSISVLMKQNMTEEDLQNHLIESQECPPLELSDTFLEKIQTEDTCSHQELHHVQESTVVQNKDWVIIGSVVICLFLMAYPWMLFRKEKYQNANCCISTTVFVLSIWALCVLWINLFPQIVRFHNWKQTNLVTERMEENPYRCCDMVSCQCAEFNGPSCNSLISRLEEGPCHNGYHCCEEVCYTCNCYTSCSGGQYSTCSMHCSTCCDCVSSVNHRKCRSKCGTCYNAVVTRSFEDENGQTVYGTLVRQCARDDRQSLDEFFAKYGPIGTQLVGYYNPHNKNEIADDISYDGGILAAFLIPSILMVLIFLGLTVTYIHLRCIKYNATTVTPF